MIEAERKSFVKCFNIQGKKGRNKGKGKNVPERTNPRGQGLASLHSSQCWYRMRSFWNTVVVAVCEMALTSLFYGVTLEHEHL